MSDAHITDAQPIVLAVEPKGVFKEGTISAALKPGVMVEIDPTVTPVGGRLGYRAATPGSSGDRQTPMILLEPQAGGTSETAYVANDRCRIYTPVPGEEMHVRVSAAGTAEDDAFAIGDRLMVVSGTSGLFIAATGTIESEPFEVTEAVSDVTAEGTLVQVQATGV